MIYSHKCPACGFSSEDREILLTCPDCCSDKITNDPPIGNFPAEDDEPHQEKDSVSQFTGSYFDELNSKDEDNDE